MRYVITCKDKPNHLPVRKENRPAHVAYLEAHLESVLCAGPTLDSGGNPSGSVLILNFDSLADAETWAAHDPYAKAGLFKSVSVTAWKKVFPEAE
jgi:uncharacterized protein YciI